MRPQGSATRAPARPALEPWEYGALGVTNPDAPGSLSYYFRHVEEACASIEGDVAEFGVYRGASLLATALLLKRAGSDKLVYGFDTFGGFPSLHSNDHPSRFEDLHEAGRIDDEHMQRIVRNRAHRAAVIGATPTTGSISTSGDFADTNRERIERVAQHLGLDNIRLVQGDFAQTLSPQGVGGLPERLCAVLVDCDLYAGYRVVLPWAHDRLAAGGTIYLDEYYSLKFPGARIATDEFCESRGVRPRLVRVDGGGFERWAILA